MTNVEVPSDIRTASKSGHSADDLAAVITAFEAAR